MLPSRKRTQGGASLCPGLSPFAPLGRTDSIDPQEFSDHAASKSDGIRPTRPLCKLHGVGYVRSSAKVNSASEEPCLQGFTHGSLGL